MKEDVSLWKEFLLIYQYYRFTSIYFLCYNYNNKINNNVR